MRIFGFAALLSMLATSGVSFAVAPTTDAAAQVAMLEAVRRADARLDAIGYRLTTANAALCRELAPTPGFALHALDQYDPALRPTARVAFGFETPVAVELVLPGTPADRAGLRANESVVAVNGISLADGAAPVASTATRDAAVALVAAQTPALPLQLDLLGQGRRRSVTVAASPGCRANFELVLGPKLIARSDGRTIQIGAGYFDRYGDDQVAVLVAHELAHVILRHRVRLEAAGVRWGVFAELGRSGRLFRQTENDADLLGVHLLRNAGYDPQLAVRFWAKEGGSLDGGLFHSRTHPGSGARSKSIAAELAATPVQAPLPYQPPVLATRDEPLR